MKFVRRFDKSSGIRMTAFGLVALLVLFVATRPSIAKGEVITRAMQQARTIALAMFQYANDHGGRYPDGDSSTAVFQKLIDGNYLTDPSACYVPIAGKEKTDPNAPLKPENVSFDVTGGASPESPPGLPLVFLTGYKVQYQPGGLAVALIAPYSSGVAERTGLNGGRGYPNSVPDPSWSLPT